MLVLSRIAGESIYIASADDECVVTVLKVSPGSAAVSLLINRASASHPGKLDALACDIMKDATVKVNANLDIALLDIREEKVRIGINAPRESAVHRFEVYQAIRGHKPFDSDEGPGSAPVPKPSSPKPPTLNARLDEPLEGDSQSWA